MMEKRDWSIKFFRESAIYLTPIYVLSQFSSRRLPVRLQTEIQLLLRQYTDADSSSEYLLSARDRPKDRSANMSELAELRAAKAEIERLRLGAVQDKQK